MNLRNSSGARPKHLQSTSPTSPDRNQPLTGHPIPNILKHFSSSAPQPTTDSSPDISKPPQVMSDPSHHLMNAYHLAGLVNNRGGEYERFRVSVEDLKKYPSKVRKFYEQQNEILDYFKEIDTILDSSHRRTCSEQSPRLQHSRLNDEDLESTPLLGPRESAEKLDREQREERDVRMAIYINFFINFVLLSGKIVVALLSNSISLIASLVDSAMDFLSTAIIWWTNRKIDSKSWQSIWQYPTGKRRMEPMGVVVFSVFMISSFVQVLVESVERLFNLSNATLSVPTTSIIVMWITILVKGVVWLWCRRKKNTSVKALAQDAENDCVLNIFSLLFPYLGQMFDLPWLDPVGGLVLSIYIITEWTGTLFDHVKNLTGRRAEPIHHQRVAYLVTRFSPLIQAVQHCHVYQAGDDLIVETDVILSPETPLPVAHDVGESVQYALESLEGITRAYCHVDFSSNPMSGHFQR
ncbi:hypothetical protein BY996DRAFT_4587205 [Phakopsora pachyrhizi]|uniref:Cation efflux protein transmembrane domain-containing protein n=1 Tax=Phakopsora pachyrhizi TaxID=170000 RepID=A0AAV0BF71_PHAPC|nr:hypothetical protein BY996DRAFT_4587205 [Phakopsora pachyrhizi]CAH7684016.1 hypothetical protein PPACK8108_LOCUS17925 [Phakopsora pachyrhizi]